MSKRKRDPTFTSSEKEDLFELIKIHFFIVESKKTDAVSIKHKTEMWRKIATEFNAVSGICPRDWTVLKNCWENLKKKAKHEQALLNKQVLESGGEPSKISLKDPFLNRVLDLIQARVTGFVNCFDLDGTPVLDIDIPKSQLLVKLNKPIGTTSSEISSTDTKDWAQCIPSTLREINNPALIKSPSPDVQQQQQPSDSHECHAFSTPPRALTPSVAATTKSRRKQFHKETSRSPSILKEKIKTLLKANAHAEEEHEVKVKILRLQEEKEKEYLKQEILKTKQEELKLKILELQLEKLKD